MRSNLPVDFIRICIGVVVLLVGSGLVLHAQNTDLPGPAPNLMTAPAGTYVIAMDNTLQSNPGYFNVKAYGLAVRLLNAQKALHWVIKAGKAKDSTDFTAPATRVFPTTAPSASRNFKAGPLLIFPRDSAGVTAIINAFNNAQTAASRVNVYQLSAPAVVDVRYILTQRPKAVILNDGNNEDIHAKYYQLAGIDSPLNYSVTAAVNLINQCYTFASEPHSNTTGATIDSIKSYVMRGGNFLAQCAAINTYENAPNGRFHTTNGITIMNDDTDPDFSYPSADLSFSQYEGRFNPDQIGGAEQNWKLATGSAYANNHHKHQTGAIGTDTNLIGQSVAKIASGRGHLVFYSGGHNYAKNNTVDCINGMRSFFNAFLTPSGLTQCDFLRFDYDLSVSKTGPAALCVGQTDTFHIVLKNNGPTQTNGTPVSLQEMMPATGFTLVSASVTTGSFNPVTGVWSIGTMANQQSDTLQIIATANASGSFTNTAYVNQSTYDYNNVNDTSRVTVTVSGADTLHLLPATGCGSFTLPWGPVVTISGTYSNTVTGTDGCDSVVVINVQVNDVSVSAVATPVLCHGASTGSVTATPTGGSTPYAYNWNTGGTTSSINNLSAGVYTVTVTDSAGCSGTASATVTQPVAPVALSHTQVNILCNSASTGSVDLTVTGGTSPYNYIWSTGATTQDVGNLAAGTYTVTVNDANGSAAGCTATATVTITQPPALARSTTQVDVLCNGASTGSIDLTVNGGVTPYSYSWSNGSTAQDINGLAAGSYSVTITDANGCTATASVTINQPSAVQTSSTQVDVLCHGASTGSVDLSVTGGTSPYTYLWSTGTTTEDISNLSAGTYTVTVNDANGSTAGCATTTSFTITQPPALTGSTSQVDILCNGSSTGSIDLTVNGGVTPYSYSWSNGATAQDINGLAAGTYSVTITDANGCTTTTDATINQPAAVQKSSTQVNVLCHGASTGSVDLSVTGGTSPYTYTWSTGATTEDISNLSAGTYTVTVNDANGSTAGCTAVTSVTITQPAAPLSVASSATPIIVNGGTSSITISATGGTPSYTGTGTFTKGAGTHVFVVTDTNGCTDSVTVILTEPGQLYIGLIMTPILCNGGESIVTVTATGGIPPYTGTGSFNYSAGTYTLMVTDSAGITDDTTFTITQPDPLVASATTGVILCHGGTTDVDVTAIGGTTPYTGTGIFTAAAGTHTYEISDANGCTATTGVTVSEPSLLQASAVGGIILCHGGTTEIDVIATGGTTPYTGTGTITVTAGTHVFEISDAGGCTATADVTIAEPSLLIAVAQVTGSGCSGKSGEALITGSGGTTPYSGTGTFSGLSPGLHPFTITDAAGCTASVTADIPAASSVKITVNASEILCYGGQSEVTVTAAGGVAPYTGTGTFFVDAGFHTFSVVDTNGCSDSVTVLLTEPKQLSASATVVQICNGKMAAVTVAATGGTTPYTGTGTFNVPPGTYSYTVTDANGCTASTSVKVSVSPALTINVTHTPILCAGGKSEVTVTAAGGTAPVTGTGKFTVGPGVHTFVVTDAAGCSDSATLVITEPKQLTAYATVDPGCNGKTAKVMITATGGTTPYIGTGTYNVPSGNYTYTVTDANGCTASVSVKVSVAPPLTINATTAPILCHGGSTTVSITAVGGSPPYTGTGSFTHKAGNHLFTVTDSKGCNEVIAVSITEPSELIATAVFNPDCDGKKGIVTVSATGGTAPYTGTGVFNIGTGNFAFTVTDANGCVSTATVNAPGFAPLIVSASAGTIPCYGDSTQILVSASGGTPPYSGTGIFTHPAGAYSVVVTDFNGCTADTMIAITQPAPLTATAVYKADCDGKKGTVTVSAAGGTAPFSGTGVFNVGPGTYTYMVTDANGCTAIAQVKAAGFTPLSVTALSTPVLCYGSTSVVTVTATGGVPPYGGTGNFNQAAGSTAYTVTDANGCTANITVTITEPALLTVTATADSSKGTITSSVNGGTAPYTYLWLPDSQTTANITVIASGIYTVEVTDANGCVVNGGAIMVMNLQCDGFRTQTQTDWGSLPSANDAAAYQQQHFASAFPAPLHLTIGCNEKLRLSNWQAVRDFLPSGNFSGLLPVGTIVDPGSGYDNMFAGELVALTLSLRFDELDASFGSSNYQLGELIIANGPFMGWTVQQVFDEANAKIGGCSSTYSISDLLQALVSINANYQNGKVNRGFLVCPNAVNNVVSPPPATGITAIAYPNPFTRSMKIQFMTADDFPEGSVLRLEIYAADGRLVAVLFDEAVSGGEVRNVEWRAPEIGEGIYFYHLYGGGKRVTGRIMHNNE